MARTMYLNFKKGEARQFAGKTVTPADNAVIPVQQLFNENSTAGEVVPMATGFVRLRYEDGTSKPFDFAKGENLVLGHEDLSDTGALMFKSKDDRAWQMTDKERKPFIDMIHENGPFDEDTLAEIRSQADMFGMESLQEYQQALIDMDEDDLFAVQEFMHQTGMDSDAYDPYDYQSYGKTDTGRYLQIELKSEPGVLRDVYEAPPSGERRQFWDMKPGEGKVNYMSMEDGEYEVKGVYEGRPFQAERDAAQESRNSLLTELSPTPQDAPGAAMARMQAMVAGMDAEEKEASDKGVEDPEEGITGYGD